jgi:hypothetical protein
VARLGWYPCGRMMCWSFGVAGLGWCPCSRLQPATRKALWKAARFICFFKIHMAREMISSKFIDNFETLPKKCSPAVSCKIEVVD